MNWLPIQSVAQISVEHILNALPAGFLIAVFAWGLLRAFRRQNSGTRFAVWFLALIAIAALPSLASLSSSLSQVSLGQVSLSQESALPFHGSLHPAVTIPEAWALFIFIAWVFGASVAMLRLAAGFWRLRLLRQNCTVINTNIDLANADLDPTVRKTIATICRSGSSGLFGTRLFASKPIQVAISEDLRVPAALGLWIRTIVLPSWAIRELPPADLNAILLHEFAHLRRWDDWTNLIQKIVRALFFFHPAVWWIEDRLSVEREMACDDAVLAETADPRGYATCLVSLLEKSLAHRGLAMAQAAVHRAREASLRLAQILDKNRSAATRVWTPAVGLLGVFSALCLATLPHAPRLVAFDQSASVSSPHSTTAIQRVSPSLSSINGAPGNGVPGVLARPVAAQMELSPKVTFTNRRDVRHTSTTAHQPAPVVAARWNPAAPREQLIEARSTSDSRATNLQAADLQSAPQFQTLVFIETTSYAASDSPVIVQVWQVTEVTWISRTTGTKINTKTRTTKPVANST